tara:strand:+ start:63944 stop:65167 length:1224 start_codon:yes stop_codon:yes gene_type:complete
MTFFDKKEDVIDIVLTDHGKRLLSRGKFKPAYYAFFDDDIIYDNAYTNGTSGTSNNAADRIKQSIRLKLQSSFSGKETESKRKRDADLLESESLSLQREEPFFEILNSKDLVSTRESRLSLKNSLGNSTVLSNKIPAWNVNVFNSEIASSSDTLSVANSNTKLKIPQLNMKQLSVDTISDSSPNETNSSNGLQFLDGTFVNVSEDNCDILIHLSEENGLNLFKDFEIEVLLKTVDANQEEIYEPLFFRKEEDSYVIEDGVIKRERVASHQDANAFADSDMVDNYLDITFDEFIENKFLMNFVSDLRFSKLEDLRGILENSKIQNAASSRDQAARSPSSRRAESSSGGLVTGKRARNPYLNISEDELSSMTSSEIDKVRKDYQNQTRTSPLTGLYNGPSDTDIGEECE